MICISIANIVQIEKIKGIQPEMVELRMDLIKQDPASLMKMLNDVPRVIATCRPDGMEDGIRLKILKELIDNGAKLIDVEIDSDPSYQKEIIEYARSKEVEVIVSWHNYNQTPGLGELEELLHSCYQLGADIAKLACLVKSKADNARLLSLYNMDGRKVILGMGELGKITRLAALKLGSEFTFVSMDDQNTTAPGQLTLDEYSSLNKIL